MKTLVEYKRYILIGGGTMADRLIPQLDSLDIELIGIADNLTSNTRAIKEYRGFDITDLSSFKDMLLDDEVCAVLAVNAFSSMGIIRDYGLITNYKYDKFFVPNPYTCLRPCVMNDDFACEKRIPTDNEIYVKIRALFHDDLSLKLYDALWKSKTYDSVEDTFELVRFSDIKDLYYFEEDYWNTYHFVKAFSEYATVFDCGAYVGDSIIPLKQVIPEPFLNYYAFEPDATNASAIRDNKEFYNACNELHVLEYGVGDKNETLNFVMPNNNQKDAGRFLDNSCDENAISIAVRRIDDLDLSIKGKLYIKMDIEGSELPALKGAENTIRSFSPYLAICVYHRKNDMVLIPEYINSLGCNYKYFLRGGFHTILWAIPYE
jgi:FkbM family methyltransferase